MVGLTVLFVVLVALAVYLAIPIATGAIASRKGRDGLAFFILAFLWGSTFSGLLILAFAFGAVGTVVGTMGIGSQHATLTLGGLGAFLAALLCCILFLLPAVLVIFMPGRVAGTSRRRVKVRAAR
jgi:hypothetical protein